MWLLKSLTSEACYRLNKVGLYKVGREDADIILQDKFCSRRQAIFYVTKSFSNELKDKESRLGHSELRLKVLSSRSGTYINEKRLCKEETALLSSQDLIKFGSREFFKVTSEPLIVCSSHTTDSELKEIKEQVEVLGGDYVDQWTQNCSLLVTSSLVVTPKVLHCLLDAKPVVTVRYLEDSTNLNSLHLNYKDYLPTAQDPRISDSYSFLPNSKRSSLFRTLHFIFFKFENSEWLKSLAISAGSTVDFFNRRRLSEYSCTAGLWVIVGLRKPESVYKFPLAYERLNERTALGIDLIQSILLCDASFFFTEPSTNLDVKSTDVFTSEFSSEKAVSQEKNNSLDSGLFTFDNFDQPQPDDSSSSETAQIDSAPQLNAIFFDHFQPEPLKKEANDNLGDTTTALGNVIFTPLYCKKRDKSGVAKDTLINRKRFIKNWRASCQKPIRLISSSYLKSHTD
ncbi:nibrin-like isoform X2 [Zophobas morio]|uniref:nibrin-like isoform X2 n=1 Tax=Zophobas morio TaxID=2755281 RepID=UPI0030839316